MKHFYLPLLLMLLWGVQLVGQCPSGDVSLSTQAQVDVFVATYPNCNNIVGNLYIGNYSNTNITDLSGLMGLRTVEGSVSIERNSGLVSLAGLDSLQSIGGSLSITRNNTLTSLDELAHLQLVEGGLFIRFNNTLQSIDGIQNLAPHHLNELHLIFNPQLSNCAIANLCTLLQDCANPYIYNNGSGCENVLEVRAACGIESPPSELGQPIIFSGGEIVNLALSDDGTHVFVAREISFTDEYDRYRASVFINVLEWNGQEWIDLGQSNALNTWTISNSPNSQPINSWAVHDFSENGTYFASRVAGQIDDSPTLFIDPLVSYEWQGGNSWSTVPRPYMDREDFAFALASDGGRIAEEHLLANGRPIVRVTQNGQQLGPSITDPFATSINSLKLSRDGSHLAVRFHTIGLGETLEIYEWSGGQWRIMPSTDPALSKATLNAFSPDGNHLICTYEDTRRYYSWDGTAWLLEDVFQNPLSGTNNWFLSADNRQMYNHLGVRRWWWDGQSWNESDNAVFPVCPNTEEQIAASIDLNMLAVRTSPTSVVVYNALPEAGFNYPLPLVCAESSPRTFEQAVSPVGGVFSGAGVSEGAQAGSFLFDPVAAGVGTHEVSYAIANDTFRSTINVVVANPPELNLPDTLRLRTPRLRLIPGLGTPQGGVYTDDNGYLVDDGNGQTFHIAEMPTLAPTTITYTIADENGCVATVSKEVVLINESPNGGGPFPNQMGEDLLSSEIAGQYGYSVSLSADGSRMAIGDPEKDLGEVYLYHLEAGEWVHQNTLIAEFRHVAFGAQVALSGDGNRLVVSAPESITPEVYAPSGYDVRGAFQLYRWNGENWVSMGQNYGSSFEGRTVDISFDGRVIALGTIYGHTLVYRDNGTYLSEEYIAGQSYGTSDIALSADGQRVAFSHAVWEAGSLYGGVSVYEWQNESWEALGQHLVHNTQEDLIDFSLDITDDGNRLVIGNPQSDIPDVPAYVQVYDWNGTDWVQVGQTLVDSMFDTPVDWDVAISADGTKLIVGAANNDVAGTAAGRAVFYVWDSNQWLEEEQILFGGDRAYDQFGFSVAASSNARTVAIGAIQENNPLSGGYVRVFLTETDTVFENTLPSLCSNTDPLTHLGGGFPYGGVYSGPGVTDNGDGQSFLFDPAQADSGTATITYTLNGIAVTNTLEVLPVPNVTLSLADTLFVEPEIPITLPGTGLPPGGIYDNPGGIFVDFGDGQRLLYTGEADFAENQIVYYTYTDALGCSQTDSAEVVVINLLVNTENVSDMIQQLLLFPNPSRNQVQLLLQCTEAIPVQVELFDLLGQRLWQSPPLWGPQLSLSLDLSTYPVGTYWVKVRVGDAWVNRRVVKM